MNNYSQFRRFGRSRLATIDTLSVAASRHHVSAMLEFDVTESRKRLRALRRTGEPVSLTAWLVKVIGLALERSPEAAAFRCGKRRMILFEDINVALLLEKEVGREKVPIPTVIGKANKKSVPEIQREIDLAKKSELAVGEIVLHRKTSIPERLYYFLPGFARRAIWRIMMRNPGFLYRKMGNAAVTPVGTTGRINGWFLHRTIHPVSFGIGSVIRKPVVVGDAVVIREILNMTVLADHDVIDGAPMVRMLQDLTRMVEKGEGLIPDQAM